MTVVVWAPIRFAALDEENHDASGVLDLAVEEFWTWLWKIVFWVNIGLFATLAVVVTIGGAIDVAKLIRSLKEAHADAQRSADD